MEYKVAIPHCYKWMAADNKKLYIEYIKGYIKSSHPGLKPVRVEGPCVICTKQ
ncbi:hypothetical protein ACPVTF_04040 [Geobacillus icigianus]|uniref:Uncharacterized protein n=1 Tax=Geobacillus subterraneus TaxID=129338 RepID=A0A679FMN6_9BACL|nr:hypothetical protein [Geobacillus subterraneus]BBW97253.1 hypothetical protein GsuE55_20860 [Geobacillus subterraneus]